MSTVHQLQTPCVHKQQRCLSSLARLSPHATVSRRALVALPLLSGFSVSQATPASASPVVNKEVDSATSPYIQELLRRTDEKREERAKERLQDYYRRNYKDYFEFQAGNIRAGNRDRLDPGTAEGVLKWLDRNKDRPRRAQPQASAEAELAAAAVAATPDGGFE